MNQRFEGFFNRIANGYEKHISFLPGYRQTISHIDKLIGASDVLVDVGTGTGSLSFKMASKTTKIIAVDISDRMLKMAKKRASKYNTRNIEFKKAEIRNIPVNDSSADIIVSNLTLHHLKNKEKLVAVQEFYRILKPNGKLIVGDLMKTAKGSLEFIKKLFQNYKKVYGYLNACCLLIKMIIEKLFLNREYPMAPLKWIKILEEVGFELTNIKNIDSMLWVSSAVKTNHDN